jgi:hypothetical protein
MLEHRFLAEGARGSEVSHRQMVLERTACRHDLRQDAGKRGVAERTGIERRRPPQDLRFPLGAVDRALLQTADALRQASARRQQLDQALVEPSSACGCASACQP